MHDGVLPECEKQAINTPILKKPGLDLNCSSNYRPISNLTFLSKLIERLVCAQLTTYLNEHQLFAPVLSAYRRHYSIETATLKVDSDIFDSAVAGQMTLLALLDLSAAFDTVGYHILLQRLYYTCGIGSTVLEWLRSFLTGRTQMVNFASEHSSPSTLTCGVPQESAVSPLLFSLYRADVVRIAQSFGVSVHCYADDLQLYVHYRAEEATTAITQLLACIQAIDRWIGSNRLKMNPDKTQFIWLSSRQQLSAVDMTPLHLHDGTVIMPSTTVSNLGAVFDCEVTILYHVNSVSRSCFYHLRQLRTMRRALTHDFAKMLAHAFFSSRVDYCNSLLFGVSAHVLRKMHAVLTAAARLVCGLGRFGYITPAMRDDLHWLSVRQRIEYKIALLVYKCLH